MKTAADLHAIADTVNNAVDRKRAIHGLLETAAETGYFLAEFKRSEYPVADFLHLRELGYKVTVHLGMIYVYWAEPFVSKNNA